MKKFSFKPIVFMMILTVIYTGILATINEITQHRISLNQQLQEKTAFLYALNVEVPSRDGVTVNTLYNDHIQEIQVNNVTLYKGYKNDELIGYILPIEGDAVWGALKAVIAVTPDFQHIIGVDILSHSETPGLGGRIDETSFKEQFRNIIIDLDQEDNYIVYRPNPGGQVDSISGATGTSNAVRRIFNNNLKLYVTEIREELQYE